MNDPYNLQRFVDAQSGCFEQACEELTQGRKSSHWMWFIFPQIKGLGHSEMSATFGISSKDEAQAYLSHPILGPRLRKCVQLVNRINARSLKEIFGSPDDLKFRSSMTLFAHIAEDPKIFSDALNKYCGGESDPATLERL
jgi:uncharacterized protein (DUF1810 family)